MASLIPLLLLSLCSNSPFAQIRLVFGNVNVFLGSRASNLTGQWNCTWGEGRFLNKLEMDTGEETFIRVLKREEEK